MLHKRVQEIETENWSLKFGKTKVTGDIDNEI